MQGTILPIFFLFLCSVISDSAETTGQNYPHVVFQLAEGLPTEIIIKKILKETLNFIESIKISLRNFQVLYL